jgi:DNA-binding NarL/FixJ family response regulator
VRDYLRYIDLTCPNLTNTEKIVFNQLCNGMSTIDIAKFNNVSVKTVKNHKQQIFSKLHLHDPEHPKNEGKAHVAVAKVLATVLDTMMKETEVETECTHGCGKP